MAEFDDVETGGENETAQMSELRKHARKLESQLSEVRKDAEKATKLERELAFAKAGIDLTDERSQFFVKGYDGELDPQTIKSAAEKHGFISKPQDLQQQAQNIQQPPAGQPVVPPQEVQAINRMDEATGGTPYPENQGQNLAQLMRQLYEQGGTPEDVARALGAHGYPVAKGFD